jgi:hypothetical protein
VYVGYGVYVDGGVPYGVGVLVKVGVLDGVIVPVAVASAMTGVIVFVLVGVLVATIAIKYFDPTVPKYMKIAETIIEIINKFRKALIVPRYLG